GRVLFGLGFLLFFFLLAIGFLFRLANSGRFADDPIANVSPIAILLVVGGSELHFEAFVRLDAPFILLGAVLKAMNVMAAWPMVTSGGQFESTVSALELDDVLHAAFAP